MSGAVITAVMLRPGEFEFRSDGESVGTFSLLDKVPATGRQLFPSVAAGVAADALTDMYRRLSDEYQRAGWSSAAEYHTQVEAIRDETTALPENLRLELKAALAAHGWPHPLTREQMTQWQDEVLSFIIAKAPPDSDVAA